MTQPPSKAAKSAPAVSLSKLLDETLVVYSEAKPAKNDAIKELVEKLAELKKLGPAAAILAKVMEREAGPTTTLDTGLAIPHARIDGITEVHAILGIYPNVVTDPQQADLPIKAIFAFVSPNEQQFFAVNLKLLRKIAVTFQPALIDKLVKAGSPQKALEVIKTKD